MRGAILPAAVLALGLTAAAPAPAPTPAQTTYNAAEAALTKRDWTAAATGFASLLPKDKAAPLSRSQAVIASRLALALTRLGRLEEARAAASRAIAALPPGDTDELADAWNTAGDAARFAFDYRQAADAYARSYDYALKADDKVGVVNARLGSATVLMTVEPKRVGADLDALLADKALTGGLAPLDMAHIFDLRARAALNAGDMGAALKAVDRALSLSGGLTTANVSVEQVAIRNDAGLVYGLRHDDEKTREYLAYTGAGHLKNMDWIGAFAGDLPVCGEEADVRPDDVAAVELAIDEHGEVKGAEPLYASRPGDVGRTFARAVGGWRWDPEALKHVEPFWRATLVLQLRCQTRPTPESLGAPVFADLSAWFRSRSVAVSPEALASRTALKAAPEAAAGGAQGAEALGPLLVTLARGKDTDATAARIAALLDAEKAPPSAYAFFYLELAGTRTPRSADIRRRAAAEAAALAPLVSRLAERWPDDVATAWLRLELAISLEEAGDFAAAAPVLHAVLETPQRALPEGAPIRRVALLHAGLAARRLGASTAAEAQIAASGLSAEQCSLFDTRPIPASLAVSEDDFPQEANRWGFEGFVREDFDIANDGRVVNPRTIIAYPPFVFDQSSERAVKSFRYIPPRIGDRSVGCLGQTQNISYRIPK